MEHFMDVEGPKHLCLRQDCGACGHAINLDEQIVTLIKETTSSSPKARGPFKFPDYGYDANGQSPKGWLLCRFPSCERCATGPETATLHVDCFNLYNKEMTADDKMDRLFTAATWRYPWKNVPAMKLEPSLDLDGGRSLDLAAEICGMPNLLNLPFELAEMVRDFARPSTLWRFASVLNLVASLSVDPFSTMESIPLSDISSWERGSAPTTSPAGNDPVIRLTIDSRGLRMIERLPEMPNPAEFRTDSFAYAVEHEQVFKGVTADFSLGFGHLNMPEGPAQLKLWDRPCPPPLEESLIYHTPVARKSLSLNTVDMDSCSGLTFFMTSKDTFAIHAHTRSRPTAHSTFERLSPRHQEVAAWVYVPFAPSDRVEGFGVRRSVTDGGHLLNNPAYLFRTALAGDFSVGSDEKRRSRTVFTHTGPGTKLVHNIAEGKPLSLIGAYPQNREQPAGIDASQLTPIATPRVGRGCFSSADLKDATHLSVFEDSVTRACKGVIIEYASGAQRAIGQCRVGEDPVVEYHHPEKICVAPVGDRKQSLKWGLGEARVIGVSSSSPLSSTDDNLLWRSFDLRGEMQFWFDRNVSQVLVA